MNSIELTEPLPPEEPVSKHTPDYIERSRVKMKAPWPAHMNFGGENEHPDIPPYNLTDRPGYSIPHVPRGDSFPW